MSMRGFGMTFGAVTFLAAALAGCGGDESGSGGAASSAASTSGTGGAGGASSTSGPASSTTSGPGGAGGSGGVQGSGGGGSGNGATQACKDCVAMVLTPNSACLKATQDCDADPDCEQWKNCAEDCFNGNDTKDCYDACDAAWPQVTQKEGLYKCTCDVCAATCTALCS